MKDCFRDVLDFHRAFKAKIGDLPAVPDIGTVAMRARLIKEECNELVEAMDEADLPGVADACADLIYVAIGLAISYGIDLRPVWEAVHHSNMAKAGGGTRADGKVLKPPGWQAPDIAAILAEQFPLERGRGVTSGRGV